jgi:CDP-diacylglycerol--serine O-phosphatidyltransferase
MMPAVTPDTPPSPKTSEKSPGNPPSRGIYLLPNLLTTGCLFSGFYSIVAAIDRNFALAGLAVFIAGAFDGLDGRVARWTRTESPFGKEYDSLADMVAFGVAPAVLVYQWGVVRIGEYGGEWRQFGWVIAFFYAACAALRLARFNTVSATGDKRYFQGLPSPSAAATVAAFVWFFAKWREPGLPGLILAFAVTGYAAALMVSSFSYLSLKQIDVNARVKVSYLIFVIGPMLFLISVDPPTMLFAMFISYATYGPVQWLVRKLRRTRAASTA